MNKKILLSVAAAATLAMTFTGCGSSDSTVAGTTGSTSLTTTDGYVYNAVASCASGSATYSDDTNLTSIINSDNPGKCTVTGGNFEDLSDANVAYSVYVPTKQERIDNNITGVNATPITTMVAYERDAGSDAETAMKKVINKLIGSIPADGTNLLELINADTTQLDNFPLYANAPTSVKAQVMQIHNTIVKMNELGVSAATIATTLKDASSFSSSDLNTSIRLNATGLTATQLNSIEILNEYINTSVTTNTPSNEASLLQTLSDANASAEVTVANLETAFAENVSDYQANLEVFYVGDVNQTLQTTAISSDTNLTFSLNDQNISLADNGAFTGSISVLFQNEGNANYSFRTVLKDINITETTTTSDMYTFALANNTNVSFAGTSYTGEITSVDTKDAQDYATDDNNTNLCAVVGTDANVSVDMSTIFTWTQAQINSADANDTVKTSYGVNGNWSTTVILSIDNNETSAQNIYKMQDDDNLSAASVSTITVDKARTGAILFNGPIFE